MIEREVGIEVYVTKHKGLGGKIRQIPEDFQVTELSSFQNDESGKYLIVEVTKRGWDTYRLISELSNQLRISRKRISCAGLKDKEAITTQKMSIYGVSEDDIGKIRLKDVELKVLGRSRTPLVLGSLMMNEFRIVIRDIDHPKSEAEEIVQEITSEIKELGGVANFFGLQRFGSRRPVTHLVGRKILDGDFEGAVMTYLCRTFDGEDERAREARDYVARTRNFREGLRIFPRHLRYEKAMMNYLVQKEDWIGCLSVLPRNLTKLFVHAYQSYLFNRILSRRIIEGLPINLAVVGDWVLFRNGRMQKVSEHNLDLVNRAISEGKAWVTAPLVGYETELAGGVQGEIEGKVLDEEKISPEDFRVDQAPHLSSKGSRRKILLQVSPSSTVGDDELNPGRRKCTLHFSLERGGYATVVVREYSKRT